jgi:hypothetical protein
VRDCDPRHGVQVLLALDIPEYSTITRVEHNQLPWPFLHQGMPEAMHLMGLV